MSSVICFNFPKSPRALCITSLYIAIGHYKTYTAIMQSYLQYRRLGKQIAAHLEKKHNPIFERIQQSPLDNSARLSSSDSESTASAEPTPVEPRDDQNPVLLGYVPEDPDDELQYVPTRQELEPSGTHLGLTLTGVDVRSRTTIEDKSLGRVFIVGFDGPDDPSNPHNWSITKRVILTINLGLIAWVVGMASAIDSAALPQAAAAFGVSDVAENLATGLVSTLSSERDDTIKTLNCMLIFSHSFYLE